VRKRVRLGVRMYLFVCACVCLREMKIVYATTKRRDRVRAVSVCII
jgi:hypothetical protein